MRLLAYHYLEKEDYEKCKECFNNALSIAPMFKNAWFTYGVVCMRTLDFSTAIVCFRQNLRMDHDNAEVCMYVCMLVCIYIKYT